MHRKFSSFNLLPNVIQSSINEVLCKNVFDPFINEKEENCVYGALSNNPSDDDKIEIADSYYHLNQIQPIFKVNESHYSFKDILVELDKQGANLQTFKEWGDSSFLNFLPPINLDKFNNFQNYVWVDSDSQPSYICIRSPLIHQQEHMLMIARKMVKQPVAILSTTTNTITVDGDCAFIFQINPAISISDSTSNNDAYIVASATTSYDHITNTYTTTITTTTSTLSVSTNNGVLHVPDVVSEIYASSYNIMRRVYSVTYFDTFKFDYDDPSTTGTNETEGLYYDQYGLTVDDPELSYDLNDWQLNNKWIHKDDVPFNMHGTPATQPIIEYQNTLEMNQWFKITRQWQYRANLNDGWEETTDTRPSVHEFNLSRSVANYSGLYLDYISLDSSNETLYVSSSTTINTGDLINIKGNSNIYEIGTITTLSGQKALKLISPVTPLIITQPSPSNAIGSIDKRFRLIGKIPSSSVEHSNEIMLNDSAAHHLYTMGKLSERSSWAYFGTAVDLGIRAASATSITINGKYPLLRGNGATPFIIITGGSLNGTYFINNEETVVTQTGTSFTTRFEVSGLPPTLTTPFGNAAFDYITNETMQVYDYLNDQNVSLKILDIVEPITANTVLTNQGIREVSKIVYDPLYNNPSSQICGNFISFNETSRGNKWLGPFVHWVYDGVVDLAYASNRSERPDSAYNTLSDDFAPNQEVSIFSTHGSLNPNMRFAKNSLNTKVFINGRLQKAGYVEGFYNGTTFNPNPSTGLCNAVKFDSPVSREDGMTILLDVSVESWSDSDVYTFGYFRTNTENEDAKKYVSGVLYYKNYQQQYIGNEYPIFNLYNRTGTFVGANELFKYDDNGNSFSNKLNDFVYKNNNKEYRFENLMVDDNGVVSYYNNTTITKPVPGMSREESSSVWRRTAYPATYVPVIKNRDGVVEPSISPTNFWEIPPYVTNNPKNITESLAFNSELYPHFNTIIEHNSKNDFTYRGGYDTVDSNDNLDRTYGEIRYDVIGTITTSSITSLLCANVALNNINFVNVIEFINYQQKMFIDTNINLALTKIIEDIADDSIPTPTTSYFDHIKQQHALNDLNIALFGDSLSKRLNGIPNVCPTVAFSGLLNKRPPHISYDHKRNIVRLQTHITQQLVNIETECALSETITNQLSTKLRAYKHEPTSPILNDFWLDSTSQMLKKWDGSAWISVVSIYDIKETIGNNLVECENALYNSCNAPYANSAPTITNAQTSDYNNVIKKQFVKYVERLNISDITINPIFSPSDPFTWNYKDVNYLNMNNPLTSSPSSSYVGCDYRYIYERLFKTPYPHLEPWRMQGYYYKPTWWDAQYKWTIADGLPARRWKSSMWTNILTGVVPAEQLLSDLSTTSGGTAGETTEYNFVSVNISPDTTTDGFGPDDLLPPYRNVVAPSAADLVVQGYILITNSSHLPATLSNPGEYGKGSYLERNWFDSITFNNDVRIIPRYLMQPFKYISKVLFNPDYLSGEFFTKTGQLESTNNCNLFTNNIQNDASSLYTYYARSKGLLGINTNAGEQWKSSDVQYGHINDQLINEVEIVQYKPDQLLQTTTIDNTRLVKRIDFTNFIISVINQSTTSKGAARFKTGWKFSVNTTTNKVKSIDVKKTFFAVVTKLNSNNTFDANLTDFTTGMAVTFTADQIISDDLSFQDIFYLIKISNSIGAVARTYNDSMSDVRVSIDDRPVGLHYIMVPNSIQPVNGIMIPKTQEVTTEVTFPTTIVGEYTLINFLVGYIEKQHENGINEANTKQGVLDATDVDWWSQINLLRDILQKLNDFSFNGGDYIDATNMVLNPYETEIRINHGEQFIIDSFVNQNGEYEDDSQLYDVYGRSISSNDIMVLRGNETSTIRSINGRQIGGGSINLLQKHSILMMPEENYKLSLGLLPNRIDEVQLRVSSAYNQRPGYVHLDGKLTKNLSNTISFNNNQLRTGTFNNYFNGMTDIDNLSYSAFENNRMYETSLLTKGTSQMFTGVFSGNVEEIIAFDMDGIIYNDSLNIPLALVVDNSINNKNLTTISQHISDADIKLDFLDSRQWPLLPHYRDELASRWNMSPKYETILTSSILSTNKLVASHKLVEFYTEYAVELTQHDRSVWMYQTIFPINFVYPNPLVPVADVFIGKITSHKKQLSVLLNDTPVDFDIVYDSTGATVQVSIADALISNTIKILISSSIALPISMVSQSGYDDLNITELDVLPYTIDVSYTIKGQYYSFDDAVVSIAYDTDAEEVAISLPQKRDLADKYMFIGVDPSSTNWKKQQVGKIWAKNIFFKNWYNSSLYSNHEQQLRDANNIDVSRDWGIYRWVESDIPPEQWYDIHEARSLGLLTSETENTAQFIGEPFNKFGSVTRATIADEWGSTIDEYSDIVADFYSQDALIEHSTALPAGTLVNVFINGAFVLVAVVDETQKILFNNITSNGQNRIIIRESAPIFEDTDTKKYIREFIFNEGQAVRDGVTFVKYYFWVKNHVDSISDVLQVFENDTKPNKIIATCLGYNDNTNGFNEMVLLNTSQRNGILKITKSNDHTWNNVKLSNNTKVPFYLWTLISHITTNFTSPYTLHDEIISSNTRYGLKSGQKLCDYEELSHIILDTIALDIHWGELTVDDIIDAIQDGTIGAVLSANYNTIPTSTVNSIFFTLLFLCLTKNNFEYNVLVTSLVDVTTQATIT